MKDQSPERAKYEKPHVIMRSTDQQQVDFEVLRKNQLKNFQNFYEVLGENPDILKQEVKEYMKVTKEYKKEYKENVKQKYDDAKKNY